MNTVEDFYLFHEPLKPVEENSGRVCVDGAEIPLYVLVGEFHVNAIL